MPSSSSSSSKAAPPPVVATPPTVRRSSFLDDPGYNQGGLDDQDEDWNTSLVYDMVPEELNCLCLELSRNPEVEIAPPPERPVVDQQTVIRVAYEEKRMADQSVAVVNGAFKFGCASVSISHTLGYHRGLSYCWKCSYYTSGRKLSYLRDDCKKGMTKQQTERMNRIRRGLPPVPDLEWPLEEGVSIPRCMVSVLADDPENAVCRITLGENASFKTW